MVINHLLTGMILQVSPFPIGRYGGVESLDAWRWTWHLEPNKIIPARDPKQCKNKMQWSDIHSSPYRQSHITFHHITTSTTRILFVGLESYVGPRSICQEPGCFWPVSDLFLTTLCDHSICEEHVWALCVSSMSEHSMCDHSMWALYVWALYVWALYVWALYVWPLHVWALCVGTLCVTTPCVSTLCVSTPCVSTMCEHSMCDHSMCEHSMCEHSMCEQHISSWAGCCRTPKSTKITTKTVLGPDVEPPKKSNKSLSFIVKILPEQRKARELPRKMHIEEVEEPKKYENCHAKPVSDPFKSSADTRKVRELPGKTNVEEVEEPETTKVYRQNP